MKMILYIGKVCHARHNPMKAFGFCPRQDDRSEQETQGFAAEPSSSKDLAALRIPGLNFACFPVLLMDRHPMVWMLE
jgi:hypothetical protein